MMWFSFALAALGALANLGVAVVYMYLHRGWKDNAFAKLFLPNLLAEGILFVWLGLARVLPEGEYRIYTSQAFYALAVGVMVQRAYMYMKEEYKLSKELRSGGN